MELLNSEPALDCIGGPWNHDIVVAFAQVCLGACDDLLVKQLVACLEKMNLRCSTPGSSIPSMSLAVENQSLFS